MRERTFTSELSVTIRTDHPLSATPSSTTITAAAAIGWHGLADLHGDIVADRDIDKILTWEGLIDSGDSKSFVEELRNEFWAACRLLVALHRRPDADQPHTLREAIEDGYPVAIIDQTPEG